MASVQSQKVDVVPVDFANTRALAAACEGSSCVVFALLGLEQTMIGTQGELLRAAVQAGVPRFIPSDYAMDFTKVAPGVNRNFDLHRRFNEMLEAAPICSSTILKGCFMDLLTGEAPLILEKLHRVLYWGQNPDWSIDFSTIDDTASFTAEAALDPDTPRFLRIAEEQISARELASVAGNVKERLYRTLRGGSLHRLQTIISIVCTLSAQCDAPFPIWQGMQYLYCMFEGSGKLAPLDNSRYPDVRWTSVAVVLGRKTG